MRFPPVEGRRGASDTRMAQSEAHFRISDTQMAQSEPHFRAPDTWTAQSEAHFGRLFIEQSNNQSSPKWSAMRFIRSRSRHQIQPTVAAKAR